MIVGKMELISRRTRNEFREFFVGYTLREIEKEFSSEEFVPDFEYDPELGGQRRELVEQYYHSIDFRSPVQIDRLLRVYESVLVDCELNLAGTEYYGDRDVLRKAFGKLIACLRQDGFEFVGSCLKSASKNVTLDHLAASASNFSAGHLTKQIQRIHESTEKDTDLAIGQSKELLETCCKVILNDLNESDFDRLEVQQLVRLTLSRLQLMPNDIPADAKGAKTIRAILGNLSMLSQGMAELRNLYGTGHGKLGEHKSLPVRHARLAVGAATTLAQFLFDTHSDRIADNGSV